MLQCKAMTFFIGYMAVFRAFHEIDSGSKGHLQVTCLRKPSSKYAKHLHLQSLYAVQQKLVAQALDPAHRVDDHAR